MPKSNSIEQVQAKVYQNSLNTCEYIDGYENANSTIRVRCIIHNNEFNTKYENVKRDTRAHYICPECQEENRSSAKITVTCAYCDKEFQKPASKLKNSKSGLYFCCREHKDLAQKIESDDKFSVIRPNHYNKIEGKNYREKAFRSYEHKCAACGWNDDKDILEVHHINENRENNDLSNLIILCPTCHRKLTSHKYILINRSIIKLGD